MTWQPIETAPKDGTEILLFERGEYGGISVLHWRREEHYLNGKPTGFADTGWCTPGEHVSAEFNAYFKPTHWHTLPEPPK